MYIYIVNKILKLLSLNEECFTFDRGIDDRYRRYNECMRKAKYVILTYVTGKKSCVKSIRGDFENDSYIEERFTEIDWRPLILQFSKADLEIHRSERAIRVGEVPGRRYILES